MGCANTETTGEDANEDNCKDLITDKFEFIDNDLVSFIDWFGDFTDYDPEDEDPFESQAGKDLLEIAEEGCKFSKTYTLVSPCKGKFLYLVRDQDDEDVSELCIDDLTDPA